MRNKMRVVKLTVTLFAVFLFLSQLGLSKEMKSEGDSDKGKCGIPDKPIITVCNPERHQDRDLQPIVVSIGGGANVHIKVTTHAQYEQEFTYEYRLSPGTPQGNSGSGEGKVIYDSVIYPGVNGYLLNVTIRHYNPFSKQWLYSKVHTESSADNKSLKIYSADSGGSHTPTYGPTWDDTIAEFTIK